MTTPSAEAYLERIGRDVLPAPTAETLRSLHRAHLFSVPFENLDIHLGTPIVLDIEAFYDKIVRRRRGGFCYELNGLFAWLLAELGFRVTLLSARVFSGSERSPEFDHMTLLVDMDEPWLADVGFGDCFLEPLRLDAEEEDEQQGWRYSLLGTGEERILRRRRPGGEWESQYSFSLVPRALEEFAERCRWQQASPESHFAQKTVCSLATKGGRVTLSGGKLLLTQDGRREERDVRTGSELREILTTTFGMNVKGLNTGPLLPGR